MGKIVVAMIEYGECPGGCENIYKVYEKHEGAYYPIDEIEKIVDDDTKDDFVISGEIGDINYDRSIPFKKAAIHYIVSCVLKRKQ